MEETSIRLNGEAEHAMWYSATPAAQREVAEWDTDMRAILSAGRGLQGRVTNNIAKRRGTSPSTVRQKFYAWRETGWVALLNKSKVKPSATLPPTFVEYWRSIIESHQRAKSAVAQSFRSLKSKLAAWERDGGVADSPHAIPGYVTAPRRSQLTKLPPGWSYDNLNRLKAAEAARRLRSVGPKAYSMMVPPVLATREGMEVGQQYFFDDEQPDVWVNFVGTNRKQMRPLGFHCLDFVSAMNIAAGFRPQILGDDHRVKSLTLRQFEWFVAHVLMRRGYREAGTQLGGELGTAKFTDRFSAAIGMATGGKVTTGHSGRFGDAACRDMLYEGQSTGNFRWKAPIESWFNLFRNYMAALPGPTGRCRDEAPEETPGLERANTWFLRQLEKLPVERRSLLISPVLEWNAFISVVHQLIGIINDRRDHHIKDYAKMGFTLPVIELEGREFPLPPETLIGMSPQERLKMEMLSAAGYSRVMNMKPSEVWERHSKGLKKLRGWHVPALMQEDAARIIKVDSHYTLKVEDQDLGADELMYIGTAAVNMHGQKITLDRGKEYLCYLNPYDAGTMQVCEATGSRRGAWIGEVALNPSFSRTDQHAIWTQYGINREATGPEREDINRRAGSERHRRAANWIWNKRVADTDTPLTPKEKKNAAARAEAEAAMDAAPAPRPSAPARKATAPVIPNPFG
ncbi:MAG: hypothetical protein V4726_00985 [Verrucomicrobiota bacterium]